MIRLIVGAKGAGKTKKIIDAANVQALLKEKDVVFITDTDRYMYELNRDVRFINTNQFEAVKSGSTLLGFLSGLFAGDNDLGAVYIDGIARITGKEVVNLKTFFNRLNKLADHESSDVILTISMNREDLPKFLMKHEE